MTQRKRFYVGRVPGVRGELFASAIEPTQQTHPQFVYVIGPFRTKRGAKWAVNNMTGVWYTVAQAERFATLGAVA